MALAITERLPIFNFFFRANLIASLRCAFCFRCDVHGRAISRPFAPHQVDTMIVQAIGLLDELDKEINTYAMRVKEWFGWHFPEMAKVRAISKQSSY